MFHQVLNGVLTFLEKITQDPQSLSKDPKVQEILKKLKGRKIFLYGGSFGGRMVLEVLKACQERTKIKLAGVISHDGSLYDLNQAPKVPVPVLILQNSNDGIVPLNEAVDYQKRLSKSQRLATDFYMPRAGNLSLSKDPKGIREKVVYVGHLHPRAEDARRREEQILDFIHRNLGGFFPANSKSLKDWRESRYVEYSVITDPESKASIEESFLALARLTYEERRFEGIKDNNDLKGTFKFEVQHGLNFW